MPRVALTTTAERASELVARCEREGLEPVALPCIDVVPAEPERLDEARALAASADLIFVTSPRAIAALWPDAGMPPVPVAAVGTSTANAVRGAGGRVAFIGDGGADALLELLQGKTRGRTIALPHASGADRSTVDFLEKAGARVVALPVYRVAPVAPGPDPVDGVVFGSPSAVSGWTLARGLEGLAIGAIGQTTAEAVAMRDATVDVVPFRPSFDDLIRLMAEHMRDRSPA